LEIFNDEWFMKYALQEAQKALDAGEIPVGAVVVAQNKIIAKAHNQTELLNDVTAHAEMLAITSAAAYLGGKYLKGCTLYVTLEPCVMCAGALAWAQIDKIVYAASDPKRGYTGLQVPIHPKTQITRGIRAQEAEALLKEFFEKIRK